MTDIDLDFHVSAGQVGGRFPRGGRAGTDVAIDLGSYVSAGQVGGRFPRGAAGGTTDVDIDLGFHAPVNQVAGRFPRGAAAGAAARIYVGGRSYGPTFEGASAGGGGASPVVAGIGWDGTAAWAWVEDGTPDYTRTVTALAADARGCYAAIQEATDDWKVVALTTTGTYRWEVESTTSYASAPRRLAVRGGVLYAVGVGARDLLLIDTADGSVIAHHTGSFADDDADESWTYSGSAAAGPDGAMFAAKEVVYNYSPVWADGIMGRNYLELVDAGGLSDYVNVDGAQFDAEAHQRLYPVTFPTGFGVWGEVTGITGIVGHWDSGTTYSAGDAVEDYGAAWPNVWVSLQNANTGHDPSSSPAWWRLPDYSDPAYARYQMTAFGDDLVQVGGFLVDRVIYGDATATLPAVDETTGLIVTNIYDYAGGEPILEAFDAEGTPLWSHTDGSIVAEWTAEAIAAGNSRVVLASYGETYSDLVFDILDAADGTRTLDPFVIGADSTDGWSCTAIAIG